MNTTFDSCIGSTLKIVDDRVKSLIKKDQETVDLDLCQGSISFNYSTDYQHAFSKKDILPFPKKINSHIRRPDANYKLGFLPAIDHVWFAIGNSLLLWNFKTSTSEVFEYVCTEPIENVDLVILSTHNKLLLSTKSSIFLHAIDQIDKEKIHITSKTSIRSNGVIMFDITTTDTNRAFMKGDDGHLYELNIICDTNGNICQSKLICHTANRLLSYLPSIFKSVPSASVKSFAVNNQEKILYLLLSDSSIHVVNICGDQYLSQERYVGKQLATIHLISLPHLKETRLMAVADNGDRFFFTCSSPNITLEYTCTSPPLPGSLIFNKMTNEQTELAFYNNGVFAAILCKSESKYFILTGSNVTKTSENNHVIFEDVYYEILDEKIWSITEANQSPSKFSHSFMPTLESSEIPAREFSVLTKSGITHYSKQRPVDYLEEVLCSERPADLLKFTERYGLTETVYLAYVSACSKKKSQKAIEFLRQLSVDQDGLLLYFARIVGGIWDKDIKQNSIFGDKTSCIQNRLKSLAETIHSAQILAKKENTNLIIRTIEVISLLSFVHHLEWDKITSGILEENKSYTFGELVTTIYGERIAQELVFSAISYTKLANASNNFIFVSNFVFNNCFSYFGEDKLTYFKGIECLDSIFEDEDDKQKAVELSLRYFKSIISIIDIARIKEISQRFYELDHHDLAIQLVFAKCETTTANVCELHDIFFSIIENAFLTKQKEKVKRVLTNALKLSNEEKYHYMFYTWLINNGHRLVLVELETPLLEKFIKTQMADKSESLACLHYYHIYREQYTQAIECLYQIAVVVPDVELEARIKCLETAYSHLHLATHLEKERAERIKSLLKIARIQQSVHNSLDKQESTKNIAKELEKSLVQEDILFKQFICPHSLYEEGLYLMNTIELYDWKFAKTAWIGIIAACSQSQNEVVSKVNSLAKRLYPSIPSFPIYIIFQILQDKCSKYGENFAESVLLQADVPEEVVSDAKTLLAKV
ncbi:MAG: Nup133 N terminal like-domain-containing protein [Benjaminiella poitrasii]|nr:MAG: Nup133 N terminal like-domain-containing protein [Benjaminiella poitrasii]